MYVKIDSYIVVNTWLPTQTLNLNTDHRRIVLNFPQNDNLNFEIELQHFQSRQTIIRVTSTRTGNNQSFLKAKIQQ